MNEQADRRALRTGRVVARAARSALRALWWCAAIELVAGLVCWVLLLRPGFGTARTDDLWITLFLLVGPGLVVAHLAWVVGGLVDLPLSLGEYALGGGDDAGPPARRLPGQLFTIAQGTRSLGRLARAGQLATAPSMLLGTLANPLYWLVVVGALLCAIFVVALAPLAVLWAAS